MTKELQLIKTKKAEEAALQAEKDRQKFTAAAATAAAEPKVVVVGVVMVDME